MTDRHGDRPDTPVTEPAPVITSKARSAEWVYVNGNQPNAAIRGGHQPCSDRPLRCRDERREVEDAR